MRKPYGTDSMELLVDIDNNIKELTCRSRAVDYA